MTDSVSNLPKPTKREYCPDCTYPKRTCICHALSRCHTPMDIVIIQDKQEHNHPKNTAKLVALSFDNVKIISAEETQTWEALLDESCVLLYPAPHALSIDDASVTVANHSTANYRKLVVLDGTWRKAKKIYLSSPKLQTLPCWQFVQPPTSKYHRQTDLKHGLSSLEAIAHTFAVTHAFDTDILLNAQDALSKHWQRHQPT